MTFRSTSNSNSRSDQVSISQSTPASGLQNLSTRPFNHRCQGSGDSRFSTYFPTDSNSKEDEVKQRSSFLFKDVAVLKANTVLTKKKPQSKSLCMNLNNFMQDDIFENNENQSIVSNSGNKDMANYVPNRDAVKPRKIF